MDCSYVRSSSLARKFFEDFPDAEKMPLLLPYEQQAAFEQHVIPLLQLSGQSTERCCEAVLQLLPSFRKEHGYQTYTSARAAADYVQSPLALCILDTAASFSLLPGSAALSIQEPAACAELLQEDLRRRLVANSLAESCGGPVDVVLNSHPAVTSAQSCTWDSDKLLLRDDAGFNSCGVHKTMPRQQHQKQQEEQQEEETESVSAAAAEVDEDVDESSGRAAAVLCYEPFKYQVQLARQQIVLGSSSSSSRTAGGSRAAAAGLNTNTILKRAAWRRQLQRECSHYLAPLLGRDGPGSVVLTGTTVASIVKGFKAAAPAGTASSSSSSSSSSYNLAFAGYPTAEAAQAALDGCITEVLTRYFARHPAPVTDSSNQHVLPLALATAHHLLLLLPEPTQPQLPTAVGLDHNALVAAAAAGAWAGTAAAAAANPEANADPAAVATAAATAAAAAHQQGQNQPLPTAVPATSSSPAAAAAAAARTASTAQGRAAASSSSSSFSGFRDIILCFDLALHPSIEALLLAAPNQLSAFAYDGDDIHTLPSAVRALASGALLLDPSAVLRGASWCGDPELAGEAGAADAQGARAAAAATAPAGSSGSTVAAAGSSSGRAAAARLLHRAVLSPEQVATAVQEVEAAASQGWQPLLLLPMLAGAAAAAVGGGCGGSSKEEKDALAATAAAAGTAGAAAQDALSGAVPSRLESGATALQLPFSPAAAVMAQQRLRGQQQQQQSLLPDAGSLWYQLLVADVGSLIEAINGSHALSAVMDCWPFSGSCTAGLTGSAAAVVTTCMGQSLVGASGLAERQWQGATAAAAGSRWWQLLAQLFERKAADTPKPQYHLCDWLDLAVPIAATGAGTVGQAALPGAVPGNNASPAVLLKQAVYLRPLLLGLQQEQSAIQQQQQHVPAVGCSSGNMKASRAGHQLQELMQKHGWVWGVITKQQAAESGSSSINGKQLPVLVDQAVRSRWWKGPIMRGSLLEEEVQRQ